MKKRLLERLRKSMLMSYGEKNSCFEKDEDAKCTFVQFLYISLLTIFVVRAGKSVMPYLSPSKCEANKCSQPDKCNEYAFVTWEFNATHLTFIFLQQNSDSQ